MSENSLSAGWCVGADLVVGVMRTRSNADDLIDDQQGPPGAHLERVKDLVAESPIAVPFARQVTTSNAEHAQQIEQDEGYHTPFSHTDHRSIKLPGSGRSLGKREIPGKRPRRPGTSPPRPCPMEIAVQAVCSGLN